MLNKEITNKIKSFGTIGVLYGGDSQEREISLLSGLAVIDSLLSQGASVSAIDIRADNKVNWLKQLQQIDIAFIALHGRGGEDGKIQGLLEMLQIPYTGSTVTASSVAMNKLLSKQLWLAQQLPTPAYWQMDDNTDIAALINTLGFPLMVKPVHEGSSIGISKADNKEQLIKAYQIAKKLDDIVIAEQWIQGKEYTASILKGQVLPLIRLQTPQQFYDYEAKYQLNSTQYDCPCGLDKSIEENLKKIALKAFNSITASGWGRIDFMLDEHNKAWLIELNTVPGLTDHSLVPMAAKQAGINFDQLIFQILVA